MKIAIFSDTFFPQVNGVANTAYRTAIALCARGHNVRVFTVSRKHLKNISETSYSKKLDIKSVFSIPFWGYPDERLTLPLGFTLRSVYVFRPDIIHAHTPFALGWEAVLASKLFSIPIIGTHHTFFDHYLKHVWLDFDWAKRFSWRFVSLYYNRCSLVLGPSRAVLDDIRNHKLITPTRIMANSIDTTLFSPVVSEKEKKKQKALLGITGDSVVYMGRLSYEKDINQLIDALVILKEIKKFVTLMLIGDGPERKKIEKYARERGVTEKVLFTGFLYGKNLVRALQSNEIFLTASKSENMPLSVLEGMSVGLPVVGVRSLGIPEIVKDNVNGYVVTPDSPREMAEKVRVILADKKLLSMLSSGARESALTYSEENVIKKLEDIYHEVINK
ncbi:MAG: glycosyltransferase [Candidatus Paceibacterota bacterium]|jgi:glycosyltransferase involved in cell wall biosynthesis